MHPAVAQGPDGPAGLGTPLLQGPDGRPKLDGGRQARLPTGEVTQSLHSQPGSKRHCSVGCGPWRVGRVQVGTGGAGSPGGKSGSGWTPGWPRPAHRWLNRGPRLCSILGRGCQGLGERQGQKTGVLLLGGAGGRTPTRGSTCRGPPPSWGAGSPSWAAARPHCTGARR